MTWPLAGDHRNRRLAAREERSAIQPCSVCQGYMGLPRTALWHLLGASASALPVAGCPDTYLIRAWVGPRWGSVPRSWKSRSASTKTSTTRPVQAVQPVFLVPFRPHRPLAALTQEYWSALAITTTDEDNEIEGLVSARTWGFKSPLRHGVKVLVRGHFGWFAGVAFPFCLLALSRVYRADESWRLRRIVSRPAAMARSRSRAACW